MTCHRRSLGLLLLLAGCTAGPDYHVPETSVARSAPAQRPFLSGAEPVFDPAPLPDHWWRLYDDKALDAYVDEALRANTDLRAADANFRRATAVVREAQAGRTVQTVIGAQTTVARVGGFTEPVPGTPYSYELGVSVSYPLDLAGGIRRSIEAASADAQAVAAMRDEVRVVVAAAVARSYSSACSANVTLAATRHVLEIERQTLDVTQRLQKGGRGTAFDVTRARAAADQSAAAIPALIAARQGALYELAALMGRVPADYPREVESCSAPPKLGKLLPIGDGAALIRRRPDIRQAERTLAAATAAVGVETAQLYPQISLGGSMGFAGPFSSFFSGSSFGGSAGPLISWRFPNRAVAHARIAQAGAAAEAASAGFDGSVLEALRQTETALDGYARNLDQEEALQHARDDAATATDQANRLFRFGRTDFLNLLTAQANLASAEVALAQAKSSVMDRQIDVFLALGGGWEA